MDRSEPSLVPEWLKGAGGGAGGASHHVQPSSVHQDESGVSLSSWQRAQPNGVSTGSSNVDYEPPRNYSTLPDRNYYSAPRRGGTGGGSSSIIERSLQDRESYSRGFSNFSRSPAFRSHEGIDRLDRDAKPGWERDRDWDRDRDRDGRDRDRISGFGGVDDRDRDRERLDTALPFRRPGLVPSLGARYEAEALPLRRSQSMSSTARAVENGEKKIVPGELGGLSTVLPASSGSLTSNMQKAAFERNFPSLGAQERGATGVVVQPNVGHVAVLSPRPLWQGPPTTRLDGNRSSTSSPGLPSNGPSRGLATASGSSGGSIVAEGWSSALAEAPSALTGSSPSVDGTAVTGPTIPNVSSVSSVTIVNTTFGTSANPQKMVDALVQNPSRVRTPPQYSVEMQRLEELAWKQSRQLIPMKPSLPKNMGLSPREKLKVKAVRATDVVAQPAGMKIRQGMGSSQVLSSPYSLPVPQRPETAKSSQAGKVVVVHKVNKEIVSVLPSTQSKSALKHDSSLLGPVSGGGSLGSSVGNAAIGGANVASTPRKQKQLLDRRAVPIPPISLPAGSLDGNLGGGSSSKDGLFGTVAGTDDRRPPMPTQNRVDFFNALRKKASVGSAINTVDKLDVVTTTKSDFVNGKEPVASLSKQGVRSPEDAGGDSLMDSFQLENGDRQLSMTKSLLDMPTIIDEFYLSIEGKEKESAINGLIMQEGPNEQLFKPETLPSVASGGATASEEEEAAFLRSLGWEENAEGGEEALTEEEISAFFQERMRLKTVPTAMQNSSNHHSCKDLRVGSVGNISSGMSSSDSESDDDCHASHPKTSTTI